MLTEDGAVDNDATLERYAAMALAQARAGAHVLGLSGMMDGQVGHVREALDGAGFTDTILLAYAAKYTSGLYGPFREAVESSLEGDRMTYQQDPANATEAVREIELDIAEGADIVMVKPAMPHLDIVRAAAEMSPVPVAAYQISGSTPRSRRRPMAGSTASAPSWSRCSASGVPAPGHPHLLRARGGRPAAVTPRHTRRCAVRRERRRPPTESAPGNRAAARGRP